MLSLIVTLTGILSLCLTWARCSALPLLEQLAACKIFGTALYISGQCRLKWQRMGSIHAPWPKKMAPSYGHSQPIAGTISHCHSSLRLQLLPWTITKSCVHKMQQWCQICPGIKAAKWMDGRLLVILSTSTVPVVNCALSHQAELSSPSNDGSDRYVKGIKPG